MSDLPPLSQEAQNLKLGLYKHYKGTMMKVLGVARHSETLEELVVYQHEEDEQTWVRPVKMFLETVVHEGKKVPRFRFVGN